MPHRRATLCGVKPHHETPRPETLAVSAGRPARVVDAPLNTPPVFASTYLGTHQVGQGERGYGRTGNDTWQSLEAAIGALEHGRALTFASGMAAAQAVLELVPSGGVVVLPTSCYLGVSAAMDRRVARHGLQVRRVDLADTARIVEAARGADLVWVESPSNPLMEVADLPALGAALGDSTTLVVDNTFATPLLQQPLTTGAHIVMHSATKFISGHSDALLGALVVNHDDEDRWASLLTTRTLHGATPGTMEAYLALRGLRTLAVRLRQAQANAAELASRLVDHPAIGRVRYPGLASDPGHRVAAQTMSGFGALVSVELADAAAAEALIDRLALWAHATSLGGVESTVERRRRWPLELDTVPEGLVRLSVGIEHVEDLWSDLEQALTVAANPP